MMLKLDEPVNYLHDLFASHASVLREELQTKRSVDMERAREYVEVCGLLRALSGHDPRRVPRGGKARPRPLRMMSRSRTVGKPHLEKGEFRRDWPITVR